MPPDRRKFAPAAARNRRPLEDVLRPLLCTRRSVLEIASGSGEHALWFSGDFPHLTWHPSDADPEARDSISDWRRIEDAAFAEPLALDVMQPAWWRDAPTVDAVVCANMIHIAPWAAAQGLIDGARHVLNPGGALILYGPFKQDGLHTAESNAAFDLNLRSSNPSWGVRDLGDVSALCHAAGLTGPNIIAMPANNLTIVFEKPA